MLRGGPGVLLQQEVTELALLLCEFLRHPFVLLTDVPEPLFHRLHETQHLLGFLLRRVSLPARGVDLLRDLPELPLEVGDALPQAALGMRGALELRLQPLLLLHRHCAAVIEGFLVEVETLPLQLELLLQALDLGLQVLPAPDLLDELRRDLLQPLLCSAPLPGIHTGPLLLRAESPLRTLLLRLESPDGCLLLGGSDLGTLGCACLHLPRLLLRQRQRLLHALKLELKQLVLLSERLVLLHAEPVKFLYLVGLLADTTALAELPDRRQKLRVPQLLGPLLELNTKGIIFLREDLRLLGEAHGALDDGLELGDALLVSEKQRRHHLHVCGPRR
mmetsp:Transcript_140609/g.365971  ORF Transcript_140609/g.365971 Transcript_140609/m.365971 type:complete len:333 (+) Transcript_140609:1007-2005(+)